MCTIGKNPPPQVCTNVVELKHKNLKFFNVMFPFELHCYRKFLAKLPY